jgi:rfaE bifunctional protein nucleotidyltransferase chain/domain
MSLSKLLGLDELTEVLNKERKKNKTIALANGGFDIIHIGHIRYLKSAKNQADILVVALNSDTSLKQLKGENRAILKEIDRARIIASFEFVDYVTIFNEITVENVLLSLKPNWHCKGSDYTVDTVPEKEVVQSYGGKISIVGGEKIKSTTEIIKVIKDKIS